MKKNSPEIEFNLLNGFLELSEVLYENFKSVQFKYCEKCGYPSGNAIKCNYCTLNEKLSL